MNQQRTPWNVMLRLSKLVKPLRWYMVLAILLGLIGNLMASFITILGGFAIVSIIASKPFESFLVMAIVFGVLRGVLHYGEQACNHYIAFRLLALIRDHVFKALRRLSPAKLDCKDKGNLISLISSDIELLEVFYAHTISPFAIYVLFTLCMTIFVWQYSWQQGLFALVSYLLVGLLLPYIASKDSGDNGRLVRRQSGELSSMVLDTLRGLNEVIQYDYLEDRIAKMDQQTELLLQSQANLKEATGRNISRTQKTILFCDIAMLFLSIFLYQKNIVPFEGLLIPVIALMSSFGPATALANLGTTLQSTFASGARVLDILDEEPVVEDVVEGENVSFDHASFDHVHFAYDSESILEDYSLEVPKNKIIGIMGRSGSGKSTTLKLLMRFYDPNAGSVNMNGINLKDINTSNLRSNESYMTQETSLFHDSIRNNIKIAKLDATDEEIIEACKKASVHDFIMTLPNGYDTEVGELGDTLSGGERQRIGLARAFLHNAPLLLLDEPTSNLDSLNEAVILKSLKEDTDGKTVILVSHRESTMRIADIIHKSESDRKS